MARQSVENLLAWMKDITRLSGWDGLVALSSDKVNSLLHQSYLIKLSEGALQVPNGSAPVPGSDYSHYFAGFALGAPALNLEDAALQRADIAVRLPVVSGVHTLMDASRGVNRILKLEVYNPLSGPALSMTLPSRTASPSVQLDLQEGTDVLLQFAGTAIEQSEGGKYFQRWLSDPATEGQVYPVGSFDYQDNALLQVRRVDLRLQREDESRAAQLDPKGAMLFFVTMQHGTTGSFPGDASNFPFLIPDDTDQPYSATAVFNQHLLYRAAFGHSVMQLLQAGEFEFIQADAEPSRQMVARGGSFEIPAGGARGQAFIFESKAFSLDAISGLQPLTVEFENSQASQHWQFPCTVEFRYRPVDDTTWTEYSPATFNVSLNHEFHINADESAIHAMEGHLFVPSTQSPEVTAVSGLAANLALAEREQINGFIGYTIKRALLEAFSQTLTVTAVEPLLEQLTLAGGWGFSPVRRALPLDLALFGRIHGAGSAFEIVQQQQVLGAGKKLQFTTEPAGQDVIWSLEVPPGSGGDSGRIDDSGEYRAPPAHTMADPVLRVLVRARDPQTNHTSVALVTIVASPIALNPLIQVCNFNEQVKLSARSIDEGQVQWSIKNPVAGESGSLIVDDGPGGDHVYIAGPEVTTKTYVLDEIEASVAGETQSSWVLVLQRPPVLQVRVVADEGLEQGQIRLQASSNGIRLSEVDWSLSPGRMDSIDAEGIYSSDSSSRDRFVVIFARVDGGDLGVLEGHVILPLPLEDSAEVLQALAR